MIIPRKKSVSTPPTSVAKPTQRCKPFSNDTKTRFLHGEGECTFIAFPESDRWFWNTPESSPSGRQHKGEICINKHAPLIRPRAKQLYCCPNQEYKVAQYVKASRHGCRATTYTPDGTTKQTAESKVLARKPVGPPFPEVLAPHENHRKKKKRSLARGASRNQTTSGSTSRHECLQYTRGHVVGDPLPRGQERVVAPHFHRYTWVHRWLGEHTGQIGAPHFHSFCLSAARCRVRLSASGQYTSSWHVAGMKQPVSNLAATCMKS